MQKELILGFLTSLNCTMLTGQITCAQKVSIYGKKQRKKQKQKQNKTILQVSYLLAYSSDFKVV